MTDHDTLCRQQHWDGGDCFDCRLIAKARADERGRQEEGWAARLNSTVAWAENGVRADLRAKVEALTDTRFGSDWVRRVDVLALIDGGSHDA